MKRSKFRIISLVLMVVFLVTIVSACGQQTADQSKQTGSAATTQAATTAVATTTAAAKPVKFTIAVCQADVEKGFSDCYLPAQEYMKLNPNVTIEFMGNAVEEHQKKMLVMAQSNSLPEIFWSTYGDMVPMVKSNVLTDITSDINNDADFKNSFNPGALDNMTFDGKIFGVPQKTDVMGFFYNKAIFDKVGLKIPETWDELLNAIKVLNKNGITPFAQGTKDTWAVWGYYLFFDRYGWGELRQNFLDKKEKFDNPNMIKAFTRLQDLAKAGAFPKNITTIDYTQMLQMFLGGKAAIYTTGSWQIADIQNSAIAKDVDFNWGPLFSDGVGNQKVGLKETSTGLWVGAKAKDDPEKFKQVMGYLKFRASDEGTKIIVEQSKMLPASKYTGDASSLGSTFNLIVNKLSDEYAARTEMPITTMTSSVNAVIWNAMTGVMNGLMTPEQACKSLDDWNATR